MNGHESIPAECRGDRASVRMAAALAFGALVDAVLWRGLTW
jgi:hypothetical protein